YSEAIEVDPLNTSLNATLYCNRATVAAKLEKYEQAIEDASKAIELNPDYIKAYQRRANCYMLIEKYEEAERDYQRIYEMDRTPENAQKLREAKKQAKMAKRKDYYKI